MIRYLNGILVEKRGDEIVVEVQGIGYAVNVPASVPDELPALGEEVKIYTYFSVREDAMQLFGFLSREDLQMYRLLISVNGVGPKAGLGIMGCLGSEQLRYAVMSEDAATIARAPGIGPKTAKKVILELKDKIDLEEMLVAPEGEDSDAAVSVAADTQSHAAVVQDAIEALVVLGYPKADAARAVRGVELSEDITVEELLKKSLKNL